MCSLPSQSTHLSGARLVAVSMPYEKDRWSLFVFGVLGDNNTCSFRYPLCCQRSGRLFLDSFTFRDNYFLKPCSVTVPSIVSLLSTILAVLSSGSLPGLKPKIASLPGLKPTACGGLRPDLSSLVRLKRSCFYLPGPLSNLL